MSRRPVVVLVVLLVIGATLVAVVRDRDGAREPNDMGFSPGAQILWSDDADLDRDLEGMADAGATWIRLDIDWSSIEPSRGTFEWEGTDRVVRAARERDLRVLALLAYTPTWARPPGTSDKGAPTDPAEFAAFAAEAVAHLAPLGVRAWEIWNEPNVASFWEPTPDPAAYTALLRRASEAIRAVDPGATVVTGGLAPAADHAPDISPVTFLAGIYEAGGAGLFDAVGHHPYHYPCAIDADDSWNAWQAAIPELRKLMVANGDAEKQLWLTEYGAPTGDSDRAVSDDEQAQLVRQAYATKRRSDWLGPMFWYSFRDAGTDRGDTEQSFGLVQHDHRAKPALREYEAAAADPTSTSLAVDGAGSGACR